MEASQNGGQDRFEYRQVVASQPDHERARAIVLRHGWNTTCFQVVNPGLEYWFGPEGDSVVAYVNSKRFRVVAGAPVCTLQSLPQIYRQFEADSIRAGMNVCYFGAESRLEGAIGSDSGHAFVLLGAQPVWDPKDWPTMVAGNKDIRAQLNRARNKGVTVEEWNVERAENSPELRSCLDEWFKLKGLPPLHFVIEPDTLGRLAYRRVFVATQDTSVVGFLVLSPIPTRSGWLTEQFPHIPSAPNGTVELMMHTAMMQLADGGYSFVTLGLSPLSRRARIDPFDNPIWLKILLGWMRKHGQRFYNFDGLDFFKSKLSPSTWEPVFAIVDQPKFSFKALWAIANAFSDNKPFRVAATGLAMAARSEAATFARSIKR